jgi:hypothetical protein
LGVSAAKKADFLSNEREDLESSKSPKEDLRKQSKCNLFFYGSQPAKVALFYLPCGKEKTTLFISIKSVFLRSKVSAKTFIYSPKVVGQNVRA